MARTVLATKPNCWATRRRGVLSQACPTASSKAPAKRRLTGQQRYFLRLNPHSGQPTRYSSITTVVRYSDHGRSPTSRSLTSAISATLRPHPKTFQLAVPTLASHPQTQGLAFFVDLAAIDSVPGQRRIFVHSFSLILLSVPKESPFENSRQSICYSDSCTEP